MKYNKLGMSDLNISELTMGTSAANVENPEDVNDIEFRGAVEQALESGINLFDTAEAYGDGRSETILGDALKGVREKVYIASKVSKKNLKRAAVINACENSLRRLGTDYIDLYFIHIPNPEIPIEETMEAMLELKQKGRIKAIGVSNFTRPQMEQAFRVGRFDALQPCYNMLWRGIERDIVPYCIEKSIGIIPYSPLVQGILSGKYGPDLVIDELDDRKRILLFQKEWFGRCLKVVDDMAPIAQKYGKSRAQVAINWVRSQKGVASVIIGGKSAKQIRENVGAAGWEFSAEDLNYLDRISRTVTDDLPDRTSFWFK